MTGAELEPITCDTSVLVPALVGWHSHHEECRDAIEDMSFIAAHVLLEAFSVLTRLPAPHRVAAKDASSLVAALPFTPVVLPPDQLMSLIAGFGGQGVRGGAAYDALVAATAHHHGLVLLSRDKRAGSTYDRLGAAHRLMSVA